ncbi:MAG: hypothetical protein HY720_15315 [Planctomycetes bacterium]|nr:hypothetical protein [Planctomycetota bacterium]
MWKTEEGSTGRLIQLCIGYFSLYTVFMVLNKYFTRKVGGVPFMTELEFTVYSTLGGTVLCILVVLALKWYRLQSNGSVELAGVKVPREYLYIIPSGICTAVVIPTTTLLFALAPTVMVATVLMRGSVIAMGRLVDEAQIRQGILKKKVYWEENVGVLVAILAVALQIFWPADNAAKKQAEPATINAAFYWVLGAYVLAYLVRIYIMNYFKNTRAKGVKLDNKGFFGIEQISATSTLILVAAGLFLWARSVAKPPELVAAFHDTIAAPHGEWPWAALVGTVFGFVAFFSVFLFLFKGRTATFAVLVNRLTSLIAGTMATIVAWQAFLPDKNPKPPDWVALGLILVAIWFLGRSEKKRARETLAAHELAKA